MRRVFILLLAAATAAAAAAAAATVAADGDDAAYDAATPRRLNVLMLSVWQKSPIIALQGLAEELAARGHTVRFAAADDERALVTAATSAATTPAGGSVEFIAAGPRLDVPPALDPPALFSGEAAYARSVFDTLTPLLDAAPPDVVVHDPLAIVGEGLAARYAVPSIAVAPHIFGVAHFGGRVAFAPTTPMVISGLAQSSLLGANVAGVVARVCNAALTAAARFGFPLLAGVLQSDARRHMALEPVYTAATETYGQRRLSIVAGLHRLPDVNARVYSALTQSVGPLLPRAPQPYDAGVGEWLDACAERRTPVVLVSKGTNSYWTPALLDAFTRALLRERSGGASPTRFAVLMLKRDDDPLDFSPEQWRAIDASRERFLVRSSLTSVLDVLRHRAVRVFVTHCGLSSLLESVYYGVPILGTPGMLDSDQPTNAAALAEAGVGETIDPRRPPYNTDAGVTDEHITELLARLLANNPVGTADKETTLRAWRPAADAERARRNRYVDVATRYALLARRLDGKRRAAELIELHADPLLRVDELYANPESAADVPFWVRHAVPETLLVALLVYAVVAAVLACARCVLCGSGRRRRVVAVADGGGGSGGSQKSKKN